MKYFYVSYQENTHNGWEPAGGLISGEHPLSWMGRQNDHGRRTIRVNVVITSFQEIDKDEYHTLINEGLVRHL